MNAQHDHQAAPDLAEQAARRTAVPAAHEHAQTEGRGGHHPDHDDDHEHHDHDHDHAFEWPEMLRIALVAVASACVG